MYKLIALDSTDKEVIIDDKISDSYHDKHPEAIHCAHDRRRGHPPPETVEGKRDLHRNLACVQVY